MGMRKASKSLSLGWSQAMSKRHARRRTWSLWGKDQESGKGGHAGPEKTGDSGARCGGAWGQGGLCLPTLKGRDRVEILTPLEAGRASEAVLLQGSLQASIWGQVLGREHSREARAPQEGTCQGSDKAGRRGVERAVAQDSCGACLTF